MLHARDLHAFVAAYSVFVFLSMTWAGAAAALVQDLVLPRMRGTAAAAFSLISILVGSGIGPYWAGKVSSLSGSLAIGISSVFLLAPVAAAVLLAAGAYALVQPTNAAAVLVAVAGLALVFFGVREVFRVVLGSSLAASAGARGERAVAWPIVAAMASMPAGPPL